MQDEDGHRTKRFKYQSREAALQDVHLPSALDRAKTFDQDDVNDTDCRLHTSIEHWRQLNLSPAFVKFAAKAGPLTESLPLLLHHADQVVQLWSTSFQEADDDALPPLLDLVEKLAQDLRSSLSQSYPNLISHLLARLRRSLPAIALTSLLSSLSSLYKNLLLSHPSQLEKSYDGLRDTIMYCMPEVQRALAEVWGSVLRQVKGETREKAVSFIVENLDDANEAAAWMIISAAKSVSHTLHTCTSALFRPLLSFYLEVPDPTTCNILLRRTITSLIHHCDTPVQFSPISDIVMEKWSSVMSENDEERARRVLELSSLLLSVRKGSRLTESQRKAFSSPFSFSIAHTQALVKFMTSVYIAAPSPIPALLSRTFSSNVKAGISLSGALIDLGAHGVHPIVLRETGKMLETDSKSALALLARLTKGLESADIIWRRTTESWLVKKLKNWQRSPDNIVEFHDILALLPSVASDAFTPSLLRIIESCLDVSDPRTDFDDSFANATWTLAASLKTISSSKNAHFVPMDWLAKAVEKWSWSALVLESVADILNARKSRLGSAISMAGLLNSLSSHSRALRISVLRLLMLSDTCQASINTTRRCLQAEEVSPDVQGVRERIVNLGRIVPALPDDDKLGADIAARWLLGQLKVNLRPLWTPTVQALSSLAERFNEQVWVLVFSDLEVLARGDPLPNLRAPSWVQEHGNGEVDDDDMEGADDQWEDERSWRDPSAHKLRQAVARWMDPAQRSKADIIRTQVPKDRLDTASYEAHLLLVLGACPSLTEKHNRAVISLFLSLGPNGNPLKLPRAKLSSWLTLFSKLHNPKALHATTSLQEIYVTLLSHADKTLQGLALTCLALYAPLWVKHEATLRALLDETRWRDALTTLQLGDSDAIENRDVFVPILTRVLFGVMLDKKGRGKRSAVLSTLAACTNEELGLLIDLMLEPLGSHSTDDHLDNAGLFQLRNLDDVGGKQQMGYLTLLGDVMRLLGSRLLRFWPSMLGATLDIVAYAQTQVAATRHEDQKEKEEEEEVDEIAIESDDNDKPSLKTARIARSLGLKRFSDFIKCHVPFDFTPFLPAAFASFISPRIPSLDSENTQAPSALLLLFHSWTLNQEHVRFLVDYNPQLLPQIYSCLVANNVKPAVTNKVLDMIENVLGFAETDRGLSDDLVRPHVSRLLANLATLVERNKGSSNLSAPLAQRQINILSHVAHHCSDASQASTLLDLFLPLLRKPNKLVNEKVKIDMLKVLQGVFPLVTDLEDDSSVVNTKTYETLSQLLQSLRSRPARQALISVFVKLKDICPRYATTAELLESLNAYSSKRLEQPDFDRRLAAFATLNEQTHENLTAREWLPLIYNMLFYIQDVEELAIRTNASYSLKKFVARASTGPSAEFEITFLRVLWPGLKNGLRTKNEVTRGEILSVIAYAALKMDKISSLQDLRFLLEDGDEEASFFTNICHIQIHRRTRALRRLADHCDQGHLRNSTLSDILIPLVGHYITSTSSTDHLLVNEAITTTGHMARQLNWGAYYGLVQRYLQKFKDRDGSERVYIRTLVTVLDNFHFPMQEEVTEESTEVQDAEDTVDISPDDGPAPDDYKQKENKRISDLVNQRLLPTLLNHMEQRDEAEDTLRIPLAVGVMKVALHLPEPIKIPQVTRLLTILSQILRSKSSETRDLTRETLCRIITALDPTYLSLAIKELRAALLRGPQLHVLAYVTHALLTHVTSGEYAAQFEVLDDCVDDVAHISAEVIFGESGKDVQSEGFKTKMREVRSASSKGLDSFTIISRYITPSRISGVLHPLRAILRETESLKVMQQVEEVLRRIANGLNSNKHLVPAELLVLCHTLISQNAKFLTETPLPRKRKDNPKDGAVVQIKGDGRVVIDHYANNSYRFTAFGLDLFQTAFRRSRFDFKDNKIINRLDPMVSVIGNTLYSNNATVLIPSLKASTSILKCPLKSVDKYLPVVIQQIMKIIRQTGSTESEVVQAALKALATIMRDCPSAQMREKDLVYLLELLGPDLEDHDRQSTVFTMLRAIVSRKFVVPEIYDLMDRVGEVMVTSQSSQVRELCRGVLLQFLLDYPQGKGRLRKQMTSLARNLSYVFESGRKSVLELLGAILTKFVSELVHEYAELLFVALVMVIANDESTKCREMAAELIKALFSRIDQKNRQQIMVQLHAWSRQWDKPALVRVSCQVSWLIVDSLQTDASELVPAILADVNTIVEYSAEVFLSTELDEPAETDEQWQVSYQALAALSKILGIFPSKVLEYGPTAINWHAITSHLLYPHAWVRVISCKLLGLLYNTSPIQEPRDDLPAESPLSSAGMRAVADKLSIQLKSENLDASLGLQVVKNLFYIGKCFAVDLSQREGGESHIADPQDGDDNSESIDDEDATPASGNPLPWLFSRLSYQAKSVYIVRRNKSSSPENWAEQPLSILRWFAAMSSHLDSSQLSQFLVHILTPVYRFVEDDTIRDPRMDEVKTLATELQDLVQSKVGTTAFSAVYSRIRQGVLDIRRERRAAKMLQTSTHPESAAKRRQQRNISKKESRKRKNHIFVERKGKVKKNRME